MRNSSLSLVDWLHFALDNALDALSDFDEAVKLDLPDPIFQHVAEARSELDMFCDNLYLLIENLERDDRS